MAHSLLIAIAGVLAAGILVWLGVALIMGRDEKVEPEPKKAMEADSAAGDDSESDEEETEEEADAEEEAEELPGALEPARNSHLVPDTITPDIAGPLSKRLDDLPPLPRVALNILPLLSSPKTSAKDIARVISIDPLLAAKLLRRVNSSFYALESKVDSIQHAVMLLGFDNIRSLTIRESFDSMLAEDSNDEFTANLLWRHMAAVSLFAKQIAQRCRGVESNTVSTIGLLHDIGMIVMMAMERDAMADSLKQSVKEKRPLCECEEGLLKFNHQIISAALTRKWNLSGELCEAIGRHHSPWNGDELNKDAAVIWLAHQAAYYFGYAYRPVQYPEEDCREIAGELGLPWPMTGIITESFLRDLKNILTMWEIDEQNEEGVEAGEESPIEVITRTD